MPDADKPAAKKPATKKKAVAPKKKAFRNMVKRKRAFRLETKKVRRGKDSSSGSETNLPPVPDINADLQVNAKYIHHGAVGSGTFGTVYLATHVESGENVAIKRTFQDRRYKNRELKIMQSISHPNIVIMRDYYHTESRTKINKPEAAGTTFLNLVMEYIPENLCEVIRSHNLERRAVPSKDAKLYAYQICRGVAYIHRQGICHRDIKPYNILVDRRDHTLKLCDFGSAKKIIIGCPNIAYMCSRYYRAPELILGDQNYGIEIDIWSTGCSIAEILLGQALFQGASSLEQLVEITKVLGIPSSKQVLSMTDGNVDMTFPPVKPRSLKETFPPDTPSDAVDMVSRMLVYDPAKRLTPFEALAHPFFDTLRTKEFLDQTGQPPTNNWTDAELSEIKRLNLGATLNPGDSSKRPSEDPSNGKGSSKKTKRDSKRSSKRSSADDAKDQDDTKNDT